jgi:hypothetical protein
LFLNPTLFLKSFAKKHGFLLGSFKKLKILTSKHTARASFQPIKRTNNIVRRIRFLKHKTSNANLQTASPATAN